MMPWACASARASSTSWQLEDADRGCPWDTAPFFEQELLEAAAFDELHREEPAAQVVGAVEVEDLDGVGVGDLTRGDALALEALQALFGELKIPVQ